MTLRCTLLLLTLASPALAFEATQPEVDAFVQADADKSGTISRPEFRVFVHSLAKAGQPNARRVVTFGAFGLAFRMTDTDKDGQLTPQELRDADRAHSPPGN